METLRIGIAGIGRWAVDVHIPNAGLIPSLEIAALCSRSAENRRRGLAAVGGSARMFSSFEELIRSDAVDAVIIAAPNDTHAQLAVAAIEAGKHVFCEKPMALGVEDAGKVAEAAKGSGLVYMVGFELRYADVAALIRKLIAGGAIGKVRTVSIRLFRPWALSKGWRSDIARSGGIFTEMNSHYADLLCYLIGQRPVRLSAMTSEPTEPKRSADVIMTCEYEASSVGIVQMILGSAGPAEASIRIDAVGTDGRIQAEMESGVVTLWHGEKASDYTPKRPDGYRPNGFCGSREILAAFRDSVLEGAENLCGADTGLLSVRMAEACAVSAAEHRTVEL